MVTLKEFKKDFIIYKSHELANGFISISYASVLGHNSVSSECTIVVEKTGGAWQSLYDAIVMSGRL